MVDNDYFQRSLSVDYLQPQLLSDGVEQGRKIVAGLNGPGIIKRFRSPLQGEIVRRRKSSLVDHEAVPDGRPQRRVCELIERTAWAESLFLK